MKINNVLVQLLITAFAATLLVHGKDMTNEEHEDIPRNLQKFEKFTAYIDSVNNNNGRRYPKLSGWVRVEREPNGGDLIINYHIRNGPKQCNDCKIGIYDGKKCQNLKYAEAFYDPDDTYNPWLASKGSTYLSNYEGTAAGFLKVYNGRGLTQHACKLVGIFDSRKDYNNAHDKENVIGCARLIPAGKDASYCQKY